MNLMETPINQLLRAMHDPNYKKLKDFVVVVLHRGAPNDRREIDGSLIISVKKDGFWYRNFQGEEVFIPAHRIIELRLKK